ncbi:hypothetical protein BDY24DRAFT_139895 [Mrakia frigida]|uniref:uncharacterized protein n=1 Tax=Mrakia frigida TaxID=29902 RepID=UPI003FCC1CC1
MSDSTIPQLEEKGPFETGPSTKQPLQPQAQHPPPPPPLPFPSASQPNDNSSTPSASLSSSKPVWPNGFLLYLDPLATQTNLRLNENLSTLTNGNPPQITSNLFEPTHFVLDPESKFGDVVLQLASSSSSSSPARLPLLVTYQWLKQCIMWSSWEPEEDFLFVDAKEDLKRRREERAKGKGREEDEEEEMEGFGEDEDGSHTEERTR